MRGSRLRFDRLFDISFGELSQAILGIRMIAPPESSGINHEQCGGVDRAALSDDQSGRSPCKAVFTRSLIFQAVTLVDL